MRKGIEAECESCKAGIRKNTGPLCDFCTTMRKIIASRATR